MKILVALSGGVDSSVVAHMLKAEGHDLVGVRFTLWSDPLAPAIADILPHKCCNPQTAYRAKKTAADLDIPYHIVDLEQEFKKNVVDTYLEDHKKGLTPNPCIGCNRTIKFGKLLELMKEFGCDRLATGHYARVVTEELSDGSARHLLLEAVDHLKDQSYYLYGLTQEQLSHVMFPLGAMQKKEVFGLAEHFGVPYDPQTYRESMDLCFFPEKSPENFLRRHLAASLQAGNIVRRDGTVVGTHEGLALYTVGQRRGLGIGGLKIPLEVVAKDALHNTLVVSEQKLERIQHVDLTDMRFISWTPDESTVLECRIRSLSPRMKGTLTSHGSTGRFTFQEPISPIAAGQSMVLYKGEEVIGGGVMNS